MNFPRQNPACCPIAKEVANIDHGKSGHTKVYDPVLIMSPYPTRHFDRFSLFCSAHSRDQRTDRQTDQLDNSSSDGILSMRPEYCSCKIIFPMLTTHYFIREKLCVAS